MFNHNEYLKRLYKDRRNLVLERLGSFCSVCGKSDKLKIVPKSETAKGRISNKLYWSVEKLIREIPNYKVLCCDCYMATVSNKNKYSPKCEVKHGTYTKYKKEKCRCEVCVNYYKTVMVKEKRKPASIHPNEYNKTVELRENAGGYMYFLDFEHPLANSAGRVLLHRHMMSVALGFWIPKDMHVHHKDYDKKNNSISNLELLSSSEHTARHMRDLGYVPKEAGVCPVCETVFIRPNLQSKYCSDRCAKVSLRKVAWPDKTELERLIYEIPFTTIAKMFGVSDNAVRKWCKHHNLTLPKFGSGHWSKSCAGKS